MALQNIWLCGLLVAYTVNSKVNVNREKIVALSLGLFMLYRLIRFPFSLN